MRWTALSSAIALAGNHLWQSTLCAAALGFLTLAMRNNCARVRYWLWFAASMKFLLPFQALLLIARQLEWRPSTQVPQAHLTVIVDSLSQPFSRPVLHLAAEASRATAIQGGGAVVPALLCAVWLCGCAVTLLTWWLRWRRVLMVVRASAPIESGRELDTLRRLARIAGVSAPIRLVSTDASLEPGVFGMLRPVLLWPRGFSDRLADDQLEAIIAHEVSHVRGRDNLATVVHLVVQTVFWFHPMVWWIGARLLDERERACDEQVIRLGSEPHVYAESILKTCQFCIESPLVCMAAVTGADLKKRIEAIMRNETGDPLNRWKRLLIAMTVAVTIAVPVVAGFLTAPPLGAQSAAVGADTPTFEVASIKLNKSGDGRVSFQNQPGGRFTATNVTLRLLIRNAYQLQDFQITGGPDWLNSDRFDIVAKAEGNDQGSFTAQPREGPTRIQLMLRALLADRFKLTVHNDNQELPVYALVVARRDGKLGAQLHPATVDCGAMVSRGRGNAPPPGAPPAGTQPPCGMRIAPGSIAASGTTMPQLANTLSMWAGRVVLDRTGLTGSYDVDLQWTPDQMPQRPPGAPEPPPIDPNGASLFTAVQEQLGLKLDSQRGPVAVLVIDRAERPTEN